MNVQEDVPMLIDLSKYQQIYLANLTNNSNKTTSDVCISMENAEYRKCEKKCVMACGSIPNISDFAVTVRECVKSACIEGCFCEPGFFRYEDKCILPEECPVRSNKSIELNTEVPKRIIKPSCSNGCKPPPKPCKQCNQHFN